MGLWGPRDSFSPNAIGLSLENQEYPLPELLKIQTPPGWWCGSSQARTAKVGALGWLVPIGLQGSSTCFTKVTKI